ncbi:tRNA (N(6)-L-threonylcarbamoyladenosine(37)-C(2))-methylthiotransferase MtaB [Sedimentibacter sp. zth1]|uniref:tRNA (N(6)-L-threonylcarbamoyladenosine(37)-C(2))- methylthiotransferase MtaB n=1 Tax=Sedimentibacter sp. zth1 TaxID=2816908 RepID=UPI001A9293F6|nr:tRNA (N(6)-L-threonylcarbamoyladenosine(37)-C(2))-methylthiotransferase MtaB [Sedimentibacter sp. zth1]QSX06846.1 tRNA (N(6)-L-threonylcarbamoyladenosine(37)-C(2))-methylthiotransferase MtaB [Sedimentibacter sp. zth1]
MLNVSFITLGCKVNQFESEAMMEIFEAEGFKIIPASKESDIFIINTCAVTKESDRKSRQLINKAKRLNKNALVAAVGCSVQLNSERISKETSVDIVIGTKNKKEVARLVKEKLQNHEINNKIEKFKPNESFEELTISKEHEKTRANIKIQDGCNQFCTYCIIPYVRGPIRSRNSDDIISEVKCLAKSGYKEVVINGIHISSYGKDVGVEGALISLVEHLNEVDGIERIRFGSLEPRIITVDFLERLSKLEKVCDQFHLSLQSGSDTILKSMNRRYSADEYIEKVDLIRKYLPNSGITTDIIVGFPGETDYEFNETLEFVKKIEFSRIHVFKYSVREGTKAAKFENQIDGRVKSTRSKILIGLAEHYANKFMETQIGKTVSVLIEKKEGNIYEGYTTNYLKAIVKSDLNIENKIIDMKVNSYKDDLLFGTQI